MFKSVLAVFAFALCAYSQTFEERALQISSEIASRHLPYGTVLNPIYVSRDSSELVTYTRCGDSAIWTGHLLAAEAFRYRVTRTPDALVAAKRAADGIKLLVDVTGAENLLARCVVLADSPYAFGPRSEERHHGEYRAQVNGKTYYWFGNTSRDQYLGVFFGLSVAYDNVDDPATRAILSDVATRLIDRLREKNWSVVMPNGDTSTVFWLRPDQQLTILQIGGQLNPARFSQAYTEFSSFIGVATPIKLEVQDPHDSYFKFNLDAISLFNLLRLEEPNGRRRESYIDAYNAFRDGTIGHGNAFFNVIDRALKGPNTTRDSETMSLMAEWLLRGRRDEFVDLRGKYRSCGDDRACSPIPVVERVRTDFLWQRSPFLLYGGGDGKVESPGIDFILPYWMGRAIGMDFNLMAVSAASAQAGLAPESLGSLYATSFPPSPKLLFEDSSGISRAATVLHASSGQINFIVPRDVAPGAVKISVTTSDGSPALATSANLQKVAPGLFSANASGKGPAAATAIRVERDGRHTPVSVFGCTGPILCHTRQIELSSDRPVYLSLYGTGIRGHSGLTVTVDGKNAPVQYAGAHPQYPGLDQINVQLPLSLRDAGEVDVVVSSGGFSSNPVRIAIE